LRSFLAFVSGVALCAIAATPAYAQAAGGGIHIPEPTDLALFLMGVVGLAIGRRTSRVRRERQDNDSL
jgi:hypothetical protein